MQTAIVVYNVPQAEYLQSLAPALLLAPGQPVPGHVTRLVLTKGCRELDPQYAPFPLVAFQDSVDAVMAHDRARGKRVDTSLVSAFAYLSGERHNFEARFSSAKEYRKGICLAIDERQRWLAFSSDKGRTCVCFDPGDCCALSRSLLQ